jgi:hypothetical protein
VADSIISERGKFWLASCDADQTAELATNGLIRIEADGTADLYLDDGEWKWGDKGEPMSTLLPRRFAIVGFLRGLNRYVRLEDAYVKKPNFVSGGFGAEILSASSCLLSDSKVVSPPPLACISSLRLPLGSLWGWLDLPMPEGQNTPEGYTLRYPPNFAREFSLAQGAVTISTAVSVAGDFNRRALSAAQRGWMDYVLAKPISLNEAATLFRDLEDLLVLLTDQECTLDWPSVEVAGSGQVGSLYCTRMRPSGSEFSFFNCWVPLSKIDNFGTIIENWISLRKEYGSALHLYLGTRRSANLYEEHKFVNLIWGLEALHRHVTNKEPKPWVSSAVTARVLALIQNELKSRERAKIKKLLEHKQEPALEEKLRVLLRGLPLDFSDDSLIRFTKRCGDRRNDISHYGGPRPGTGYENFILDIHRLSGALSHLYHALILQRVGVRPKQIHHVFVEGFQSFQIKARLAEADLRFKQHAEADPTASSG